MSEAWSEHQSCARCGTTLGAEFSTTRLGVRFCLTCFKETVEEREREPTHDPGLEDVCHRCDGSLINGYRENYVGVYFCLTCFERTHTPDGRPRAEWLDTDCTDRTPTEPREKGLDRNWVTSTRDRDMEDDEEEEGIYLHDVFFVTTILALVMYAMARFGGALLGLGGY